jgi:N-acetylornithine carbamoyltransferase
MFDPSFKGRDFITILDYTQEEVIKILDFADELKAKFKAGIPHKYLEDQTLFMIFYNQSLRTRNSFEAGMTQLGGHAHFLDPSKIYTPALEGDEVAYSTERVSDVARVLDRMGHGIAIRIYGDPVGWQNGKHGRHYDRPRALRWIQGRQVRHELGLQPVGAQAPLGSAQCGHRGRDRGL